MAKTKEPTKAKEEILEEAPEGDTTVSEENALEADAVTEALKPQAENDTEATEPVKADADTANSIEYVDYCLPFLPGKEMGDSQTVTINGKNYQVQYGVPVKVPLGVKEVLDDMIAQNRRTREKIERLTKEEKCIATFE